MYQFHLLIDGERLLGKIGQKAAHQLDQHSAHLLRYRAIGSAGLVLKSRRKPEKLKVDSSVFGLGVELDATPDTGVEVEAPLVKGSNSERSARCIGVRELEGVDSGRSLDTGLGAGAAGIPALMGAGAPRALTKGATYFHTRSVNPRWARVFERTADIGAHLFYRDPVRISSR